MGRAQARDVACIIREIEADTDMALGGEVIYLIRFDVIDDLSELAGVGKVSIMEKKLTIWKMRVFIEMVDTVSVEGA